MERELFFYYILAANFFKTFVCGISRTVPVPASAG
jgi:hypothetical protein